MKNKYIEKGATIYLVAPSFGCTTYPYEEKLELSILNLEKEGYNVIEGPNCYFDLGFVSSNTPELRAKEFMDAYKTDSDVIMSVGGGEMMFDMLEHVDFEEIKKLPPKWFVGFSDNTNLTYTLTTICDIETIYGNNAPNFFLYPFVLDTKDTLAMLNGKKEFRGYPKFQIENDDPLSPYYLSKTKIIRKYNYEAPFEGKLIGGCLDILELIAGTKYDNTKNYIEKYKDEGIIYFFEACDLNALSIRRALLHLKYCGWFKYLKGFVIGRSMHYKEKVFGKDPIDSYIDVLKDYNVPILLDVDLGHLAPSMPFRCGASAKVEMIGKNIKITYKD